MKVMVSKGLSESNRVFHTVMETIMARKKAVKKVEQKKTDLAIEKKPETLKVKF